jgi:hypothetical protein
MPALSFVPSPDVNVVLNALLDIYERRDLPSPGGRGDGGEGRRHAIRVDVHSMALPGYHSQVDPNARLIANEQFAALEKLGHVRLAWLRGQEGHLLESVTLVPDAGRADELFIWLHRVPVAALRRQLRDLLLAERFRFGDWRLRVIECTLAQLKETKSPAPFSLTDEDFNRDLLAALAALDTVREETPYRVFSVHVFNDSKRFEWLKGALVTLARRHQPEWADLSDEETLRELALVANPGYLYLYGAWRLVDDAGQVLTLGEFYPSVGLPAAQAARVQHVEVNATRVVCVENQTTFYETIRHENDDLAAICLWGNPSPACRHLLQCLAQSAPEGVSLLVWADLDYGGLNILAQLRRISPRFRPYRMDIATLDAHSQWGKPLTRADEKNLRRLLLNPMLADMQPLIARMLEREIKLEQEAVGFTSVP